MLGSDGSGFIADLVSRVAGKGVDGVSAEHIGKRIFEINFDTNDIELIRTTTDDATSLTVVHDGRKGIANFNGRTTQQCAFAIQTAMTGMQGGIADNANGLCEDASSVDIQLGDEWADEEAMLDAVDAHMNEVKRVFPDILLFRACSYTFTMAHRTFCNSAGVSHAERRGSYKVAVTFAAKEGHKTTSFNYSGASAFSPFQRLLNAGTLQRSISDAVISLEGRPVKGKFVGDLIVAPECMGALLGHVAGALAGYALMSGTTPFAETLGEDIAPSSFSLLSQPRCVDFPGGAFFDSDGVNTESVGLIERGRHCDYLMDLYAARKLGRKANGGHRNLVVPAGNMPAQELIENTERGVLLCRFSGGNPNSNLDFSGVAKNSFLIEDGRIVCPLVATMIAGNLARLLANVRALSSDSVNFGHASFPYMATAGVTVSGGRIAAPS